MSSARGRRVLSVPDHGPGHRGRPLSKNRVLEEGDPAVLDMGPIYEGYNGDCMRTGFAGEPTDEFKELYRVNYEAMYAGIEVIKPGIHISEVDAAVRKTARSFGYDDDRFDTGHGIGLNCCELPVCMKAGVADSRLDLVLEPGMCFTLAALLQDVGRQHVHPGRTRGDGHGVGRRRRGVDERAVHRGMPGGAGRVARSWPRGERTMTAARKRVPTDPSQFIPADQMNFEQRPIDMKAPILLDRSATIQATSATGPEGDRANRTTARRRDPHVGVRIRARGQPDVGLRRRVPGRVRGAAGT